MLRNAISFTRLPWCCDSNNSNNRAVPENEDKNRLISQNYF